MGVEKENISYLYHCWHSPLHAILPSFHHHHHHHILSSFFVLYFNINFDITQCVYILYMFVCNTLCIYIHTDPFSKNMKSLKIRHFFCTCMEINSILFYPKDSKIIVFKQHTHRQKMHQHKKKQTIRE